jgi:hypothetical protein
MGTVGRLYESRMASASRPLRRLGASRARALADLEAGVRIEPVGGCDQGLDVPFEGAVSGSAMWSLG